jgi:hypothetical protein
VAAARTRGKHIRYAAEGLRILPCLACNGVSAALRPLVDSYGSASTRHERDFEGDELTLKMSGMEAAARCMKSRPRPELDECRLVVLVHG